MYGGKHRMELIMNKNRSSDNKTLSLVIPCYNEQDVLPLLFDRLETFKNDQTLKIEYIFVDDGSTDNTWDQLSEYCNDRSYADAFQLSRNFGHQTAVSAGLYQVTGDLVAVIDADLQDPPEVIPGMIKEWEKGNDVVYAIRKNRKENFILKFCYFLFYRILKKMAQIDVPLDSGDFSLMDRKVVDQLNAMPEHNRFIRGMRGWVGFKQTGFEYERDSRAAGAPKYNFRKLLQLAMDGMISFSSVPLRLAGWLGLFAALFGFIYLIIELIKMFFFQSPPGGWASTIAIIVFFGGVQLIMLGILGQYVGRIFDEVKNRPHFIISDNTRKT